jgi:hypothetical protein
MWWVQSAWMGCGNHRRCWRWDGWILGVKVASIVWIKGRGYCVRDLIRNQQVGAFQPLASAQEEAMVAVTELAFVACDVVAGLISWGLDPEPTPAPVVAGDAAAPPQQLAVKEGAAFNAMSGTTSRAEAA